MSFLTTHKSLCLHQPVRRFKWSVSDKKTRKLFASKQIYKQNHVLLLRSAESDTQAPPGETTGFEDNCVRKNFVFVELKG